MGKPTRGRKDILRIRASHVAGTSRNRNNRALDEYLANQRKKSKCGKENQSI